MSEIDPLQALTIFVGQYPNQLQAALELGISPAYLSDLLRGKRAFSDRMLDKLGLKRVIIHT
jgi:Helix-turn-helix